MPRPVSVTRMRASWGVAFLSIVSPIVTDPHEVYFIALVNKLFNIVVMISWSKTAMISLVISNFIVIFLFGLDSAYIIPMSSIKELRFP